MITNKKKIIVGMSGGIDSSMAVYLLQQQGWQPIGVSLNMPVFKGKKDFSGAKKVCKKLKITHHIIDVQELFKHKVLKYFINELGNCRTPNPCIICNRNLKFQSLLAFAQQQGIQYIATGHYAKIAISKRQKAKGISYQLLTPRDNTKDQTYNLCFLKKDWLPYIIFPLADYLKTDIYKLAKKLGYDFLVTQKQSQDFCYVDNKYLPKYLSQKLGNKPGPIKDEQGKILGQHNGLHFYTFGQRKGIKINGGPWFVKSFDIKNDALIVTKNEKSLSQTEAILSPFNFVSIPPITKPMKVMAKIRYRQPLSAATIYPAHDYKMKIVFDKPQRALTPGQFAVFYLPAEALAKEGSGNICLGGGRIL